MAKRKLGDKERGGKGDGARKQPPPGGADDGGAKWSKSKKKRMRAKLSKQNSRQQEGVHVGGGGGDGPGQRQRKQQQTKGRSEGNNGQARRKKKLKQKHESPSHDAGTAGDDDGSGPKQPRELITSARAKSALQQSFLARLSGSRFRELNEDLYTTTSDTAFKRFSENPELFDQYHEGFRKQVSQWPVNPVDVIIRWIRKTGGQKQGFKKEPLVVADFGCGDAKLGKELGGKGKSKKQKKQSSESQKNVENQFKVHSFDLVANGNPLITPCDMANVPLDDGAADFAVFCLALMGTNIADFIREAHRVLKPDGLIKIAEVRSRFEATADGDDGHGGGRGKKRTDDSLLNEFIDTMDELGFECTQKDRSNKMFILMEFAKTGERPSSEATFTAKPCIYKRR